MNLEILFLKDFFHLIYLILWFFPGLQSYLEQLQTHLSQKQTDFKARNENIKQFAKRIAELQDSITVLESDCRNKGIDPKDNSNHAEEFVLALQGNFLEFFVYFYGILYVFHSA